MVNQMHPRSTASATALRRAARDVELLIVAIPFLPNAHGCDRLRSSLPLHAM